MKKRRHICAAFFIMYCLDVDTTDEILIVVTTGQAADHNTVFGRGGVDVLTIANVDACMRASLAGVAAGIIEKYQIAGLQFADAVYLGADAALPLTGCGMGQGVTELLVNIHGETGAVKPPAEAPPQTYRVPRCFIAVSEIALDEVAEEVMSSRSLRM